MRVMQIEGDWGLDHIRLAERPDPTPGPGEVVLRMKAVSLNFRDTVLVNRGYGRRSGELPLVPVGDGAGEVIALGEGVDGFAEGDLVIPAFSQTWISGPFTERAWGGTLGGPLDGTMQEMMCLRAEALVKAPAHMSAAEAATLPCAAMTAWNALAGQGHVQSGDVVVIQGTGGVSLFGLQIAKLHGAEVVLTSSSDEKLEQGRAMGADHLINYRETPEWGRAVREITGGRGADHVVEVGGAGTLAQSIEAVRIGGHIALIGVLTGGEINPMPILRKSIRLNGIYVGSTEMFEAMNRAIAAHGLKPVIDADFAFDAAPDAYRHMEAAGHFGKIVIEMEN